MAEHLMQLPREELERMLQEHETARPDAGRPVGDLSLVEYREYQAQLTTWADRKRALELVIFLKRDKSGPIVPAVDPMGDPRCKPTTQQPAKRAATAAEPHRPKRTVQEVRHAASPEKAGALLDGPQLAPPLHLESESQCQRQEPAMPKPLTLEELIQRYHTTLASMPALEVNQEGWEQAAKRLYNLRYKIGQLDAAKAYGLPPAPPSPFSSRGQARRAQTAKENLPTKPHFDDKPPAARSEADLADDPEEEVTLEDLQERIQAARQELGSILSDAQLLTRADRAMLSIDMTELVIVANGVDAALTPHQVR